MRNLFLALLCTFAFVFHTASARAEDAAPAPDFAATMVQAKKGDTKAQVNLGVMYANGQGVAKDNLEATKWYTQAARHGDAMGQFLLAQMFFYGAEGIDKNYAEAAKWYGAAAKQGNAMAQSTLGVMYTKGFGVGQDFKEAYFWFLVSASSGWEPAVTGRDQLVRRLTPVDAAAVQRRAKEWKPEAAAAANTPANKTAPAPAPANKTTPAPAPAPAH